MVFFTVFFGMLPFFAGLAIPLIAFSRFMMADGADKEVPARIVWLKSAGYGTIVSVALSAFIALLFWVGMYWIPLMKATFGWQS